MEINEAEYKKQAENYLKKWKCLPDGEVFFTHSSLLWPVKTGQNSLMLKIVKPDDDEANSAEVLSYYDGNGAVRVVEFDENIQLLERAISNKDISSLENMVLNGNDDQATHIICDVIEKLHKTSSKKESPKNLIPFRERSETMRQHLKEGRVKDIDRPIFQRAYDMYDDLIEQTQDKETVLHGDIHHFNILSDKNRGWLAIDPKGILGPRVYEYANSLCNPYMHESIVADSNRMERQASIIAERANLNIDSLLNFTFLHACQCAAWSLFEPDKGYWLACVKTAAKLAKINV